MTYVDNAPFDLSAPLVPGRAYDVLNSLVDRLKIAGRVEFNYSESDFATSERTPIELRLAKIQSAILGVSRYLPKGFALGLNRQFANLMADDAWEDEDELPSLSALYTFHTMLRTTHSANRPGIGTNGRGSISAFWGVGNSRLTIECYPASKTFWVLTRENEKGETERAAGECSVGRLVEVLQPYHPEVWFG